jgi:hypothetical protein
MRELATGHRQQRERPTIRRERVREQRLKLRQETRKGTRSINDVLRLVLQETVDRLRAAKGGALKKAAAKDDEADAEKKPETKAGAESKSRSKSEPMRQPRRRGIPRAVRRAVFDRDKGQCTWRAADGRQCQAKAFLEFNHRRAFALGGEHTVDNINLLCRAHNQFDAIAVFGEAAVLRRSSDAAMPTAANGRKRL